MAGLENQTFAGFEIISELGRGGMGAVYKARQPRLDRLVALKIMATELAADPDFVARFKREANAAAALNHEGIVQVFSAGEFEKTHFIAMEFVEGETLRAHIERQGKLDPREAIAVTVLVAQALQYAWNKARIIHRDIKPENIFLSRAGEVKVGDLGLAKTVGGGTTSLTQTGTMMGSPHYISPEQARGLSDIDFKTDIYSLGCTLYHMLTGRPPYTGTDPLVVINKHVNEPPPAIFKVWPTCPIPLALLVGRMLAKQRHERPASYENLVEQLHEVREKLKPATTVAPVSASEPTQVLPTPAPAQPTPTPKPAVAKTPTPSLKAREAKSVTRDSRLVIGGVVAAAVLLLGGLFLWSPWRGRTDEQGRSEDTKTGSESRLQAESAPTQPAKAGTPNAALPVAENWQDWIAEQRRSGTMPKDFNDTGGAWLSPKAGTAIRLGKTIRNGALRVTFTLPKGKRAQMVLEMRTLHRTAYGASIGAADNMIVYRAEQGQINKIAVAKLPAGFDPMAEMTLEFRVVGEELTCKLNGQTVATCRDSTLTQEGEATIRCTTPDIRVSRIEVLNLDGASTSSTTSRTTAVSNAPPVISNWKDVTSFVRVDMEKKQAAHQEGGWVVATREPGGAANVVYQSLSGIAMRGRFRNECELHLVVSGPPWKYYVIGLARAGGSFSRTSFEGIDRQLTKKTHPLSSFQYASADEHDFLVTRAGDLLSAWVDGVFVGSARDATFTNGTARCYLKHPGDAIRNLAFADISASVSADSALRIPQSAIAPDAGWQNAINLLPLIDPQKDAVGGKWTWSDNTLVSDSAQNGRIAIPYQPPQEYDYRLVFHHTKGYTPADAGQVIQILSKDGRLFSWIMGAKKGEFIAFETVAGANSADQANPTIIQRKPALKKNVTYTSLVEVRNDGLKAYLNDELMAQHKTDYKDMGIVPHWKLPDPTLLGVGSWLTKMVIEKLEVREVTGKGTFTRGAPVSASAAEWTTLPNGWRVGEPVNIGPIVNSPAAESDPAVSSDGLTLFFMSERPGGQGDGYDLWMCRRQTAREEWGSPTNLGPTVNTPYQDGAPCLSRDGLTLYFCSDRPGGQGNTDLWMSTRRNTADPWGTPENLGPTVNHAGYDERPCIAADGLTLIFSSSRAGGHGSRDIWMCARDRIGAPWDAPVNLGPAVNSKEQENGACLSPDGLTLFFSSERPGGQGNYDLWMSTRDSKAEPFGEPVNLGLVVNTVNPDMQPALSADGRTLYGTTFQSRHGIQGGFDLWQAPLLPPVASSNTPTLQHSNLPAPADAFCREVAALPAEQQVARVVAELKKLNPDFDGQERHKIEGGAVTELVLSPNDGARIRDLTPVRALRKLQKLTCSGRGGGSPRSPLADLSPLAGLRLTELRIYNTSVSDLSPLKGMPLENISCSNCLVTDLSPLAGMPLKSFSCYGNRNLRDLSPLKGAPLTYLACLQTAVDDLSPLCDAPLTRLEIPETRVSDLSVLRGMKLATLYCEATPVTDFSPLKETTIATLRCNFDPQRDTAVLRSIKTLEKINNLPVAEFWKKVEAGEVPKP